MRIKYMMQAASGKGLVCFCYLNPVILSERSESKDLRTFDPYRRASVRRSFDSFRKSAIFFSRSG